MSKNRNQKIKNDKWEDDLLSEKEMGDLQTFAEIIVEIVIEEMNKENLEKISLKDKEITNEKP